jgi:ABC-type branched-subunit amino acid transport system ATPase component
MAMVEIHNLCKNFSSVKAVNHVSLEVENGEMLCLLGPSGCGKTTLLRLLSGFLEADEGEILMNDGGLRSSFRCGVAKEKAADTSSLLHLVHKTSKNRRSGDFLPCKLQRKRSFRNGP